MGSLMNWKLFQLIQNLVQSHCTPGSLESITVKHDWHFKFLIHWTMFLHLFIWKTSVQENKTRYFFVQVLVTTYPQLLLHPEISLLIKIILRSLQRNVIYCVKSVQIRSLFWSVLFWSVFPCTWAEYEDLYGVNLRIQLEYGTIKTRKNSVFGHFWRSD